MNDSYQEEVFMLRDENARLEAEAAPLRAALREEEVWLDRLSNSTHPPKGVYERRTALASALSSDAGKGWVSPEVREQVVEQIDLLIANHNRVHPCTLCNSELRKLRAALDALKGVE